MGKAMTSTITVEDMIVISCRKYGIEPDIPLAIARLETGNFQSEGFRQCNNIGGLSENEILYAYKTREEGVDKFVRLLADRYFALGLDTPEEISKKYCPVNADAWAEAVIELMEEEETNERKRIERNFKETQDVD